MTCVRRELPRSNVRESRDIVLVSAIAGVEGSPFDCRTLGRRRGCDHGSGCDALADPALFELRYGWAICPMAQMKPSSSRPTATTATVDFLCRLVRLWNLAFNRFSHFSAMATMSLG